MKWHPVKNLPPKNPEYESTYGFTDVYDTVTVIFTDGIIQRIGYATIDTCEGSSTWKTIPGDDVIHGVTHWKSLDALPNCYNTLTPYELSHGCLWNL